MFSKSLRLKEENPQKYNTWEAGVSADSHHNIIVTLSHLEADKEQAKLQNPEMNKLKLFWVAVLNSL